MGREIHPRKDPPHSLAPFRLSCEALGNASALVRFKLHRSLVQPVSHSKALRIVRGGPGIDDFRAAIVGGIALPVGRKGAEENKTVPGTERRYGYAFTDRCSIEAAIKARKSFKHSVYSLPVPFPFFSLHTSCFALG